MIKMIYKEITGRLGNQMFQYATVKSYKKKFNLNDQIILDFSKLKLLGTKEQGFCNQLDCFNITDYKSKKIKFNYYTCLWTYIHKFIIYYILKDEKKIYKFENKIQKFLNKKGIFYFSYGYYPLTIMNKKNKYFYGDFESPMYFDNIKDCLIKDFTPKYDKLKKNSKLYKVIENKNSICISIRRGDFVTDSEIAKKHLVCTDKYYYKAIEEMNKRVSNPQYVVFSDDIKWCKENLTFPKNTVYEDGTDPIWEKLRLMYSCKNFIISNSTFSWWAQYLSRNKDKIVIAPDKWKNYSYKESGKFDIYEKDWIIISSKGE